MATERTLSIIKPDATGRNLTGQINARLEAAGRANSWLAGRLQNLKEELASKEQAVETYRSDNGLITSAGSMK